MQTSQSKKQYIYWGPTAKKQPGWNAAVKMMSVTIKQKLLITLYILITFLITGCQASSMANVPSDFLFTMDVRSGGEYDGGVHVNISINANGRGRYEIYDSGGTIEYDTNHMITYLPSQIIDKGQFKLNEAELEGLWNAINENDFFNLTDDYRMSIGFSYAFVVVEANGTSHIVDNIGMEVPEVKAIVEVTDSIMPKDINLEYGEGFIP